MRRVIEVICAKYFIIRVYTLIAYSDGIFEELIGVNSRVKGFSGVCWSASKNGITQFSSYVFINNEKNIVFFNKENPETFVKYGKYEMYIQDKKLIKAGRCRRKKYEETKTYKKTE